MAEWKIIEEIPGQSEPQEWNILEEMPNAEPDPAPAQNHMRLAPNDFGAMGDSVIASLDQFKRANGVEPPTPGAVKPPAEPKTRYAGPQTSRAGSLLGNVAQGATEMVSSMPKQLAIESGRMMDATAKALAKIDQGQPVTQYEVPSGVWGLVQTYQNGSPEVRQALRRKIGRLDADPRQQAPFQAGEALEQEVKGALPVNPEYQGEIPQSIARGIGSGLGFLAVGVLGRAAGVPGVVATMAPGYAANSVQGFQDAIQSGADLDKAYQSSQLNGVAGLSEALPISQALSRYDKATAGAFRGSLRKAWEALKGGGEEAVQEFFQQTVQNLGASKILKYDEQRGVFQGTGEAAGVGFTVGALFNTLASMLGAKMRYKDLRSGQESEVPPPAVETQTEEEAPLAPPEGQETATEPQPAPEPAPEPQPAPAPTDFPGDLPPQAGETQDIGETFGPEPTQPGEAPPPITAPSAKAGTPMDLTSWLRRAGGVKEEAGELKTSGITARARPGLLNNRTGMTLDEAAFKAWEEGFFPDLTERPTVAQFLDRLAGDFNGYSKAYHPDSAPDLAIIEWEKMVVEEADRLGIAVAGRPLQEVADEINQEYGSGQAAMVRRLPPRPTPQMTLDQVDADAAAIRGQGAGDPRLPLVERRKVKDETLARLGRRATDRATDQTDQGEQNVLPGAERISDRELAERRMQGKLQPKKPQKAMDEGLFSEDGPQGEMDMMAVDKSWAPGQNYEGLVEDREAVREPVEETPEQRKPDPIRREKILRPLVKALKVPTYRGVGRHKALGYARRDNRAVHLARNADIEVAAHEFAHILDYRFPEIRRQWLPASNANKTVRDELKGISYDKKKTYEGFAEFVRLWSTQKELAQEKAPAFLEWWEKFIARQDNKEWGPAIRKAQEDFHDWFAQGHLQRVRSKIGAGGPIEDVLNTTGDKFRQAVLDDLQGVLVAERESFGGQVRNGAYETARMARAATSIADGAIRWGAPSWAKGENRIVYLDGGGDPATIVKDGKVNLNPAYEPWGLENILAPVSDDLENFGLYAVGKRAEYLMKQGRENLFTKAEINAMLALETPERAKAFRQWNRFNSQLLDFAESNGVIDPISRAGWETNVYLPFWRVSEEGEARPAKGDSQGKVSLIKRLTGGTQNIGDPIENMLRNTKLLVESSIMNHARKTIVDEIGKSKESGRFFDNLSKRDLPVKVQTEQVAQKFWESLGVNYRALQQGMLPDGLEPETVQLIERAFEENGALMQFWLHNQDPNMTNQIAVMRNGKSEFYQVADPLLYRSLLSLPRKVTDGAIMRVLKSFRRVGQMTITYAFDFWYRNFVRDQVMAATMSRHGYRPFLDASRGLSHRFAEDATYMEYIANGGGLAGFYNAEGSIHKWVEHFYKKHSIPYELVVNTPRKFLHMLERFADSFETATRIGYFQRALEKGESPRQAAYLSREISTDFAMRGDLPWLNRLYDSVMFLKAGAVGQDRVYRGFRHDPNRMAIAAKTGLLATASVMLYLQNYGFELYEGLEDWDKDSHWHIFLPRDDAPEDAPLKDRYYHFRLPKPWEIGSIGTIGERMVEGFLKEKPLDAGKAIARVIREAFRYEVFPQFYAPIHEQMTNRKSYFDRPIESFADASLPPWMRSTGTSATFKALGENVIRRLPRKAQVSPARLEALLKGYFNTAAIYGLTLSDAIFFDDLPDMRADQMPVLRSIIRQQPRTKYVNEMYDMLQAATEARRGARRMMKEHEKGLAEEMYLSKENLEYGRLQSAASAVSKATANQRAVVEAKDIEDIRKIAEAYKSYMPNKKLPPRVRSAWKDRTALKRQVIDMLSDFKSGLAKDAIEDVKRGRKEYPKLREKLQKEYFPERNPTR